TSAYPLPGQGGSSAAPGKRAYSSCGNRREYFMEYFLMTLLRFWKELLNRSTSFTDHVNVDAFVNSSSTYMDKYTRYSQRNNKHNEDTKRSNDDRMTRFP